ncbi:unnamed protein product [Allacma fusca]|uniref:Uncharacterized protein n=1 Tax=Allacma fusca TaxID=39272 RepID=A0A8J2LYR6_9HEXA|nr:unnamed protein product [Allacma fusca]
MELEKFQLEEQSVTMSELKYPNEALEPSKEALGYGISVAPSSKSRGSLEINALREVVEKMRSDDDGPNASEESIQKIFSTLRSRCLEVDGVSCGLKITNCSTCNLSSPLYHVPQRCGAKQRLPLWIDSGKKDVICFSGTGDYCIFLVSFDIGTTLLRLTIFCRIDSYETCKLGMGFSSVNLPLDAALYSGLMGSSCLSQNWVMSEQSDTPVEIFSTQDGVTCVMIVANGLNTAIKLRRCRSCERSTCAEVPPSGVDMIYATAKLSIEAAIADSTLLRMEIKPSRHETFASN